MAAIFHLSKQEEEGEGLYEHKDNVGEKASRSLSLSLLSPYQIENNNLESSID